MSFTRLNYALIFLGLIIGILASPNVLVVLSADHHLQNHTIVEINVYRTVIVLLCFLNLAGITLWPRFAHRHFLKSVQDDFRNWRAPDLNITRRIAIFGLSGLSLCTLLVFIIAFASREHFEKSWFHILVDESGIIETTQALFLLVAGLMQIKVAGSAFLRSRAISNLIGMMFGVLLVICFAEELSWGQHIFGFSTPDSLAELNTQGEFNLHNIGSYWFNHFVIVAMCLYLCVLPVLGSLNALFIYPFDRMCVPIPPLETIPFVIMAMAMDEHAAIAKYWGTTHWRLSEGRELIIDLILLIVVVNMHGYCQQTERVTNTAATVSTRR